MRVSSACLQLGSAITYASTVRRISQQTQHKEQQRQAFARLLTLILNNLRNPRAKIAHGARISQNLRAERNLHALVISRLRLPNTRLPRNRPPRSAHNTHAHNAQRILKPLAPTSLDIRDGGQRARATAATSLRVAAVATGQTNVAGVATAEEGCFDAVGAAGGGLALAARVLEVVVYALRDEDQVGEAEVDCEGDDGGHEAGPDCADEVCDIPDKPDSQEGEGDAVCGALFVVLDQLGDLRWVSWGGREVACAGRSLGPIRKERCDG
jgi:hypothetical protein